MRILVTAGNTQTPIDKVRCLTNIFTGRTGASIALHAQERGHRTTLFTSHPETVRDLPPERLDCFTFRTFDNLQMLLGRRLPVDDFDAIVHCAAVSDYLAAGVYSPAEHTHFRSESGRWESEDAAGPALIDRTAGTVKSDEPELWLRLVRAPKLIDCIRRDWGFRGLLVKFKLEVGVSDEQLLAIAERSRIHSGADLMVANTLEGASEWAFLGPLDGTYRRVERRELAERLLTALELYPGKHSDG